MEKDRITIIKNVVENGANPKAAAIKLCRSLKTVNRMVEKYKTYGAEGLIHGNKGKTPSNKLDHDNIFEIFQTKYYDFNNVHLCEILEENEGISVSEGTIRTILKKRDTLSVKAHRRTKKNLKQKLKELSKKTTEQQDQLIQLETESFTGIPPPTQPRSKYFGEEIQVDASEHRWFANIKTYLHLAIDDATGRIVGAFFDYQETLLGYYMVLYQILTTYGIPMLFKTDRRTIFEYKLKKIKEINDDTYTQFSFACNQLGIELLASSVPEFKPRVERSFLTLQGRLIQEMRLAGVSTLDEANAFLHSYISKFNQQFAITDGIESCFSMQPSEQQIRQILVTYMKRIIHKGHDIIINKKNYSLINKEGKKVYLLPKTKVSVITTMDKQMFVLHKNIFYSLEEILERELYSKAVDLENEPNIKKPKPKYIPPSDHPWRTYAKKFDLNYAQ